MGSGSEVSKQAAKIVLTDDNFATLVRAVDLGRDINRRISTYVRLQLTILSSVLQLMVYATIFNINGGVALFPLQLLFCKFFVVITVVIGFIVDVPDPGVMQRPPRKPGTKIVNRPQIIRWVVTGFVVAVTALAVLEWGPGGGAGGLLVKAARRRGSAAEGFAGPAVLGLVVCAYASGVALHGNGVIAAFAGGLAFGTAGGRRGEPLVPFVEETGALVSLLVWLAFGAVAVAPAAEDLTWQIALYAVLSLTVIRIVPVAIALAGARLGQATILLVGWFGPRGLASVVFALLASEELGSHTAGHAVAVITITVLLSVIAHGATAGPLATRYARLLARSSNALAGAEVPGMPERRLIRRTASARAPVAGAGPDRPNSPPGG